MKLARWRSSLHFGKGRASFKRKGLRHHPFSALAVVCVVVLMTLGGLLTILTNGAHAAGITRIQSTTGSNSGATTISATLGTAPIDGDALIAVIGTRGTAANQVTSISETGATWVKATSVVNSSGNTTDIWYALNVSGAATSITVNLASLKASVVVSEYSNIAAVSAIDQATSATGSGTSASTGTTPTTTVANELWVGALTVSGSGTFSTPTNSFTLVNQIQSGGNPSSNRESVALLDKIVSATGTASTGATISTSSAWSGAIVTFKPGSQFGMVGYRLFSNQDSTAVATALANQNIGATLTASGQAFRLRMLIGVSLADVTIGNQSFKLQYRSMGSACDDTGTWSDVTTATAIAYNNNPTPADGAPLTANATLDPTATGSTTRTQTYEEANNFSNSQAAIANGENGEWDFSLKDNGATAGTTYCLRAATTAGATLANNTVFPQVTTLPPPITQRAYIFQQDDGTTVNTNSNNGTANTPLTNVKIGERLVARIQLDYTGSGSTSGNNYQLYYDKNDGNFLPVKAGADIAPTSGLSGVSGAALTAAAAGTCISGTTFTSGMWHEQTAITTPISLLSNQCTELAFMIDTSLASAGTTYRLKLRNGSQDIANYAVYPTLTTISSAVGQIRASKDSIASLPACTDTTWGCETIDTTVDGGTLWSSLAIDHEGNPWISYYDATNTDLKVAHYVGSGGNCSSTRWDCFVVATSSGQDGTNTSIGVDPYDHVWVSYRNGATGSLDVAVNYNDPNMPACTLSGWDCVSVDTSNTQLGYESSLAFDANGLPYVSYNDSTNNAVKVAWYAGTGGTCSSSAWNCETVDALGSNSLDGDYSSIAFDPQGYAWVSYYDGTNSALKVATTSPSFGSTCTSSRWNCAIVDNSADDGQYESLAINPATGKPWIIYQDLTAPAVRYASYVGTGGTCTSTAWNCSAVSTSQGVGFDGSLAFGPDGKAWFNYFKNVGTNDVLEFAKYVGTGGTGCGTATDWTCNTVDSQSTKTGEYGSDKALKFDASGTAWVSYRDDISTHLKVAHTLLPHADNSLKYRLDNAEYTAIGSADGAYDSMSATTNTPIYNFTSVHSANTDTIAPTWVGKSDVAASTNNIHVQIYRYGTTNAWQEIATNTTCAANTACTISPTTITTNLSEYYQASGSNYLLHFRVYQDSGTTKTLQTDNFSLASLGSAPSTPASLAQNKVTGGATIATGGWTNENQVQFGASVSASANDTLQLCVEKEPLGTNFTGTETACGTGVVYSGTPITATVTLTGLSDNQYHWQARVKNSTGSYSAWVAYGGNAESASDFGVDTSAPTGTVYDGSSTGVEQTLNDGTLTNLSANWNINSNTSGLATYEYSIGTTPGGTDIAPWTSVTGTSKTVTGLSLNTSQVYYFNIRTTDNAGNQSVISSSGQMVAPSLGFSVSASTISFDNLNAANSYTSTKTVNLTVTTNARNGYQVHASATQNLTNQSGAMFSMFSGGTYAAPAAWTSGLYGFGYTSSDTSVGGTNRFNSATCPGGGAAPCYAPYNQTLPGDVIVDGSAPATAGDAYTITNRITANSTQPAGKYSTTLTYSANAIY